jgi:hypothetical protein
LVHDDVVRPGLGVCDVAVFAGQSALEDDCEDDSLPSLAPMVAEPGRDEEEDEVSCDEVCAMDRTGAAIRTARVAVTAASDIVDFMAMTFQWGNGPRF